MTNRITQGMISTNLLRNLNNNLNKMTDLQNQMATTKKINKPSDDPVGLSFAMRYRTELTSNDQYQKNVDSATSWLDFTDTMMTQTTEVLHRTRELAVQGATGSNSVSSMNAIKQEMLQLSQQLTTIGNSDFNGKHVFNGQVTDVEPYAKQIIQDPLTNQYTIKAKNSQPDIADINFEISQDVTLPVNISGQKVFGSNMDSDNLFKVMEDLVNALNNNDTKQVSNLIGSLDSRMNKFLEVRAEIGAKVNRVQLSDDRLKDTSINLQALQSKTEDADMAELITNLKTSENVYQASLAVGNKVITPSLVDFLR